MGGVEDGGAGQPREVAGLREVVHHLAGCGRPRERGPNVVVLHVEPLEPDHLVRAQELGLGRLDEREEALRVAAPPLLKLTLLLQLLERELADRLQQTEARLAVGPVALADEALVDERGQHLQ